MRIGFWASLIVGTILCQAVLWSPSIPLGVPGEWVWGKIDGEVDTSWNLLMLAAMACVYVLFVTTAATRLEDRPWTGEPAAWLAGLVILGGTWLWIVEECSPTPARLGKAAFVLFYPSSSGYFTLAREEPAPAALLAGYETRMRGGDVLHIGTHPPGLIVTYHALNRLVQVPAVAAVLEATQPWSFREACDIIARNSRQSPPPRRLRPEDRLVLWLATLLVLASAALAVIPLYHLLCRGVDRASAFRAAALWPAVPAAAVFVPKSDVLLAALGLTMVFCWLRAVDRRSAGWAVAAGLGTWIGMMVSLAVLPVVLLMALHSPRDWNALSEPGRFDQGTWTRSLPPRRCLLGAAAGFLVPVVVLALTCHINLLAVWWLNLRNHAAFYGAYERTYWKWLVVNPVEVVFAAGWPVVLLAGISAGMAIRSSWSRWHQAAMVIVLVWGILWLSGKNSGEAARLWILLYPWLIWLGGHAIPRLPAPGKSGRWHPFDTVLAVQMVCSALTVARVNGFDHVS